MEVESAVAPELNQSIVSPVDELYFSIWWLSLVIPSEAVTKISVPSDFPTCPPLPVNFKLGVVVEINTGKFVIAVVVAILV